MADRLHPATIRHVHVMAFTMVELLVVIGIIAILAALVLPTLTKGQQKAQGIQCMSSHRQLALAWKMYSDDNQDKLLYASEATWIPETLAGAWVTGTLDFNTNNRSNWDPEVDIKKSPMWPYCGKNLGIWRCPSDKSFVMVKGEKKPRVRSMSMNVFMGGWGETYGGWDRIYGSIYTDYRIFTKQSQMSGLAPDKLFVFLDMREDSIDMGNFATSMRGWPDRPGEYEFFDLPGNYHHYANGFSFADGHAEIKRWKDPRTTPPLKRDGLVDDTFKSPNNQDIRWLQERATRKK